MQIGISKFKVVFAWQELNMVQAQSEQNTNASTP